MTRPVVVGQGGQPPRSPDFTQVGETEVHRGWAITLNRAQFVDPDGTPFERDVIRHPGAVAIVPLTNRRSVLLVRQYRPAVDRWLLEIPAGTRDVAGEPPEDTARRELAEEVGYEADRMEVLGSCLNTPGFCDERTTLFVAEGLHAVGLDRQGVEERHMTIEEIALDRFDRLVDDGAIEDAVTILAVLLAHHRQQRAH